MSVHRFDFLVIGSGIAGLWFTYKVSRYGTVLVITKKEDTESNTNYAQGGIAAAVAEDDSPDIHYEDTLAAGQGLAKPEVVRLVVDAGPALVRELADLGVEFSTHRNAHGVAHFDLGQEGGHRRRRIVHAQDHTGLAIEHGLVRTVRSATGVTISEQHFALDVLVDERGRCSGATVLDHRSGRIETVLAGTTLLATGGIGQAYQHTTNPPIATGDGIAMGFRAGASIANMEFIQFHPTALWGSDIDGRTFLVSEAVRGEGAILRTQDGATFMERYHPDGSLAPRDAVARAIDSELKRRGEQYVLLDATHLDAERTRQRFPHIYETCLRFGIDITRQPIPVVPAAHYVCGGLLVNSWAETTVPGLFAAGECACTGLHGANRLASNSLLEALVFADRAAQKAGADRPQGRRHAVCEKQDQIIGAQSGVAGQRAEAVRAELRQLMWDYAGIVRSDVGLAKAAARLAELAAEVESEPATGVHALETRNLLTVARLIVGCARRRPESRGLHFNQDHPDKNDHYRKDTVVTRQDPLG